MKKALLVALVIMGASLPSLPASAEHGTSTTFFRSVRGTRWTDNEAHFFCWSGGWSNYLGPAQNINAADTTIEGMNRWRNATDLSSIWVTGGEENPCGNINFNQRWADANGNPDNFCDDVNPNASPTVDYEDISSAVGASAIAVTTACNLDSDDFIEYFYIVFNESKIGGNINWNWDCSACPALGNYDYLGLLMHEFGHGLGIDGGWFAEGGYTGHFTESSSSCPDTSGRQTMCQGATGMYHGQGRPGTWARTLGTHDIGIVDEFYP